MKLFLLLLFAVFSCSFSYSQNLKWGNVSTFMNGFDEQGKIDLVNGKYFQLVADPSDNLYVSEYQPGSLKWKKRDSLIFSASFPQLTSFVQNTTIFIGLEDNSILQLYKFNTVTNNLTVAAPPVNINANGSCHLFIHPNGTPYLISNGFYDDLRIYRYNGAIWETLNLMAFANSGLSGDPRHWYFSSSTNELYVGISEFSRKVVKIPLSTFTIGSCVSTDILEGGSPLSFAGTVDFIGDGITEPQILISRKNGLTTKTYEIPYSASPIDIQPLGILPFYIDEIHHASNRQEANYKLGKSGPSLTSTDEQFLKKYEAGSWSNVGPSFNIPVINQYFYSKGSPIDQKAFVRFQEDVSSVLFSRAFMLSNAPTLVSAPTPSSALCVGNINQIFENIEVEDIDGEKVHVLSVIQSNQSVYSNLSAQYISPVAGNPSISKFTLFGTALIAGTPTTLSIVVTDGFVIDTLNIGTVTPTAAQPALSFSDPILKFCSNENIIELSDRVSLYNEGKFTLNGVELPGTTINGISLSQIAPDPFLDFITYRTIIDGCLVRITAPYEISTVGVATTSSGGAINCGQENGSVTVSFVPGTVPAVSVEWSNGQSSTTIDSLGVGPYYFNVTDQNGCNVRGGVSVDPIGVSVTSFVTPISCNNSNDGAINLTLTGFTNPYVVWSNGATGINLSNLQPGTYWAYIQDVNGCNISRSFKLSNPAPISASFSTYDPDCGDNNGQIFGTFSGGAGAYTYDWIGTGQTTSTLSGLTYGFYEVEVTDQNGCSERFEYELNDYQALLIKDSVIPTSCTETNGVIIVQLVDNPFGALPFLTHSWNDQQNLFLSRNSLDSGTYILDVVSGPSGFNGLECHASKRIHVGVKLPTPQQICVVTVDTATTTNVVIWEKNGEENISHYNIYRENTQAGHFMLIDTVQFSNVSNFNDVIASPEIRSWRYRISPVNICGVEGPRSIAHKTLHMNSIITQANGTQILWDDYEGPADISNYVVWRFSSQNGWEDLSPAVSIGTSSFTDLSAAGLTNTDYFVETILTTRCSAQKVNDFNSSRSNRERGSFSVGEGTGASNNSIIEINDLFKLFPNPANEWILINSLSTVESATFELINIHGLVISTHAFDGTSVKIDLSELPIGYYFIRISGKSQGIPFIKN